MEYACEHCDYETTIKKYWERHVNTYRHKLNIKPYKCDICDATFTLKRNLNNHKNKCEIDNKHDMDTMTEIKVIILEEKLSCAEKIAEVKEKLVEEKEKHIKQITDIYERQLEQKDKQIMAVNKNVGKSISALKYLAMTYPNAPQLKPLEMCDITKILSINDIEEILITKFTENVAGEFIGRLLLDYLIKNDSKTQSVWGSDKTRLKYYTKDIHNWVKDDNGIMLTENIIIPLFENLKPKLQTYLDKYVEQNKNELEINPQKCVYRSIIHDLINQTLIKNVNSKKVIIKKKLKNQILSYIFPYLQLKMFI